MVLGVAIGMICLAWFPMHSELALLDSVTDPEETHVHCFGAFDLDSVVGNARSCGIVCACWCGWLGVAQFFQRVTKRARFLAIVEQGGKFRFSGAGHHLPKNGAHHMDRGVKWDVT